ncbi:MAG: WHG domain-containing protein, partial [Polyangiaceae bacterium]|nr:WHG domain-containing protein [Polyangiaceae bacterium]
LMGQTTGFIYHHWGALDPFLLEVSGLGWKALVAEVAAAAASKGTGAAIAAAYLEFAVSHPTLYWLMAERRMNDELVRSTFARGAALPSYGAWVSFLEIARRTDPTITPARARLVHAAAHGFASQLLSGRLTSTPETAAIPPRELCARITADLGELFFTAPGAKRAKSARPAPPGKKQRPGRRRP